MILETRFATALGLKSARNAICFICLAHREGKKTEIQGQQRAQKWEKHGTEYPAKGPWFTVEELNQAADVTLLELS